MTTLLSRGGSSGARSRPPRHDGGRGARSSRLERLGGLLSRFPRAIVVTAVLLAVTGGVVGAGVLESMSSDVGDPAAESRTALERVRDASGTGPAPTDLVLLVRLPAALGSPGADDRIQEVADRLAALDGVADVVSPAGLPRQAALESGLISFDQRTAVVTAGLQASAEATDVAAEVIDELGGDDVEVGGSAAVELDINDRIAADLTRAESLAFPILLVLGFWIFRGVVAAFVPLLVGGLAILTTLGALRVVNSQLLLSQYVLNLVVGLGLGLAIDYCLFLVSRYREEILVDGYGRAAVVRTVRTAGHTVLFSAATVVMAMATLTLFPQRFLYSMGIGGVLVTLAAALLAITVVPALLVLLGPRIDSWALPRWRQARERESADAASGRWYAVSREVMRYAFTVFPLAVLIAALLASPALDTRFGDVDQTSLPTSSPSRQVSDRLASEFPDGGRAGVFLVATAPRSAARAVDRLAAEAVATAGRVARPAGSPSYLGDRTWLVPLSVDGASYDEVTTDAVTAIRGVDSDLPFLVGGDAAAFVDLETSIADILPWALLIVSVAVLLVMLLLTRSVVLSVKTLLLNALNVSMTFGVLVWIFQYGHLEWLLRFESTGRIDLMQPILVAIIAFGLSTDYGVFLFARIMEAHDEGRDDVEAVSSGLGRSGRIISSAALLLCIAIGAFSTSSILFIKQLGVGAAVAVFLDATLVRALLVPSAMRLMGRANWWSPAFLRRVLGGRSG